jgi:putative ABC transport system permease protein
MNALPFPELRFAIRRLRKDAGSTIAAVAALACAIGAAVATWSLLSAVLLKPLPIAEAERLYLVDDVPPPNVAPSWVATHRYPLLEAVRESRTFEAVAAGGPALGPVLVLEQGDVPQRRQVYFAADDFFATLGIGAALGRTFTKDEDKRGAPVVAVLSDRYWRNTFNADPNVLGRTVTFSGKPATIIGVLPRGFRGLHLSEAPDLYLPLHVVGDIDHDLARMAQARTADPLTLFSWIRIVGRLPPGETTAAAAARLNALSCFCERDLTQGEVGPLSLTNVNTAAVPHFARTGAAQFTTVLSITVGLLLLVGSLTVGMLLLVRTEDRRDELTIRLALGATGTRLAASIAVEAAILCALGTALAVPVAIGLFRGIQAFEIPGRIAVAELDLTLDAGAWLAVTGVTLAATCLIALVASLTGAVAAVRSPVQSRALATPRVTRRAPRTVLIAGQVAITLVLVTGAGLFTRSLIEALTLNPAVETDRIVAANIGLGQYGYTRERAATFVEELLLTLRQNGVVHSAGISQAGGSSQAGTRVAIDGAARELPSGIEYFYVDRSFFSALGLPVVIGRDFEPSETVDSPVAVVSASLSQFVAGSGNPVGHRISDWESSFRLAQGQAPLRSPEIIGVVPDLIADVRDTTPLVVYQVLTRPLTFGLATTTLYVRAADDPRAAIREVTAAVKALDSRVMLQDVMTLDERIGRQMNPQRFGIYVLGALGGIALLLTVLGTYVVAQSMVVRRRRELGIRAALGAQSGQLRRLVLGDTARLVGIGLVAGLALTVAGARLIRSLLYQVGPLDPLTLVTTAAVIFGLALLVSLRPAFEATRVDLNRTLREE